MEHSLWDSANTVKGWDAFQWINEGSTGCVVLQISCTEPLTNSAITVVLPNNVSARVEGLPKLKHDTSVLTLVDVFCKGLSPIPTFHVLPETTVIQHGPAKSTDLRQVVELCAGIGVMTFGLKEAGFVTKVACEVREPFVRVYNHLHPEVDIVHGDICEPSCIREIVLRSPRSCTVVAGFNCQPYSRAGSMLGSADPRSASLRGVLWIGFLLRSPMFILECVVEASQNRHVLEELKTFSGQCGFHCSDVVLKLHEVWPTRRDRWWVVLSAKSLGKVQLNSFPWIMPQKLTKHVLPHPLAISSDDHDELVLSEPELERFIQFQPDLSSMFPPQGGFCPTLLHSLGSQVVGCSCGCRDGGFSDQTLAKGLFGILFPTRQSVTIGDHVVPAVRHPHPDEVAILSAMPFPETWPGPLRAVLAGIGQQANPLQALWIACQIVAHLDVLISGSTKVSPRGTLEAYMDRVSSQCRNRLSKQFDVAPVPNEDAMAVVTDEPILGMVSNTEPKCTIVDPKTGSITPFRLDSCECTVGHLIAAEAQLARQPVLVEVIDFLTGGPIDDSEHLIGKQVVINTIPLTDFSTEDKHDEMVGEPIHVDEEISPTWSFAIDDGYLSPIPGNPSHASDHDTEMIDQPEAAEMPMQCHEPLSLLQSDQFLSLQQPVIESVHMLSSLRSHTMSSSVRSVLLWQQEDTWADDEMFWHLQQCIVRSGKSTVAVLDPLLASTVAREYRPRLIHDWFTSLDFSPTIIVSAVCLDGHWSPFIWTWNEASVVAHSWDIPSLAPQAKHLHDAIAKAVNARTFVVHTHHRMDQAFSACGICAIRYVDNYLQGKMLPTTTEEVWHLHSIGKQVFKQYLESVDQVCRSWLWGNGLDKQVHLRLSDLLRQHGVVPDQIEPRIQVILLAIGVPQVQKAVTGSAPWRSLKALANQSQPKVQLVMPDELRAVVEAKAATGVGNKKKTKQPDPQKPTKPAPLDPTKLAFDEGAFVNDKGQPVQQLQAGQLGPLVEGVALALYQDVEPFLRNGQLVANGGLAVFLINVDEQSMTTALSWAQCRVVLRCVANGEPMLINGYLVQLGKSFITQARAKHVIDLPDIPATCVKAAIYRDAVSADWDSIVAGPVKFLLQRIEVLQICQAESCKCPKWHRLDTDTRDPVFDVWRRQWLNLSMRPVQPGQADVFMVNLRIAKVLEAKVLAASGVSGVFLEPRSLDAKDPILDYQVLWLPKQSVADLIHTKQCNPGIVGLARLGSRLGIRLKTEDVATIGKIIKPDAVLLTGGPKTAFEIGPVPFGVDRSGLAKLCAAWGWIAKPVHPSKSITGLGTIWVVHACTDPPSSVFSLKDKHEVVITKLPSKGAQPVQPQVAVGSSETLGLCSLQAKPDVATDPWLVKDPWAASASRLATSKPIKFDVDVGLQQVEERIEKSIMAKLPAPRQDMDVDGGASSAAESAATARIQALEAQVHQLASGHQKLETRIDEAAKKSDAQICQLQHQMSAQLEGQGARIEDLFRGQMAQLEALLSKKPRYE